MEIFNITSSDNFLVFQQHRKVKLALQYLIVRDEKWEIVQNFKENLKYKMLIFRET